MRKTITALLAGILSFGSVNTSKAQEQPSAGTLNVLQNNNYYSLKQQEEAKNLKETKKSVDFLVETNILPIIYSQINSVEISSLSIYRTNEGFGFRQTDKESEFEYNIDFSINPEKYNKNQYIEMHPYKIVKPNFNVDIACEYSKPDVLNQKGLLKLDGTINGQSFKLNFTYVDGRLTEAHGNLGSKSITIAYEPAKGKGLERLVESGVVTIDKDRYKVELGIKQTELFSYNGFSVSKLK